jgi:hypothetical protein
MALTTKEIQTQKALMEQQIENIQKDLDAKQKDYEDAFGEPHKKRGGGTIKAILIAIPIGLIAGVVAVYYLKKYYPAVVPF